VRARKRASGRDYRRRVGLVKDILLICASNDHEMSTWAYDGLPQLLRKKAFMTPLALATIAALTPSDIRVRIWDEHTRGPVDEAAEFGACDLVGVTAFSSHLRRARKIARIARAKGIPVVIGGPGVTSAPESCRDDFDVLFVGEAETTWPQFIEDFRAGTHKREYQALEKPDMALSPPPRWESVVKELPDYVTGGVQVSRGCPFDCEFCGVWQIFGRKMRTKPVDQVIEEVRTLQRLGMHTILFCSDNFVGAPKYAKELLRRVIELNAEFPRPLAYAAELDITIARDPEMLELLADANLCNLLVGIETPNRESLIEVRKRQNLRGDLVETCHKIQAYGLPIDGSIVVGFDHDTTATFDDVFTFLQAACIPLPKMHMLKAIPGTELHARLSAEGRVINSAGIGSGGSAEYLDAGVHTNILPGRMSRVELMQGYDRLLARIWDWGNFEQRVTGFVRRVERPPRLPIEAPGTGHAAYLRTCLDAYPPEGRACAERLVALTEATAPAILPVVVKLIFRQLFEVARLPKIHRQLMSQIELESAEQRKAG
jgi:radical SAM superfamily enzyme YgiQ (UPF0313 family)